MPNKQTKKIRGIFEGPPASGIWWIRYADEFGQMHREKVGMRSRAIEVYRQRKTEIRHGKFEPDDVKLKNRQCLVSDVIEDRLKQAASLRDFRNVEQRLGWWRERLGNRPVKSIVAHDIEQARKTLIDQGAQPATCNRYLACFKAALSYAILNGKAQKNAVKYVKLAKEDNSRVRWLSPEEEVRLFRVLPTQYHSMVLVALHTGLRKSEQFSLEWQDIDFQQGQVKVRNSKSGKSRIIPMSQTVAEIFRNLSRVRLINNPFVFPGEKPGTRRTDLPKVLGRVFEAGRN